MLYVNVRFMKICSILCVLMLNIVHNFDALSMFDKLCVLLSNCDIVKLTAKIFRDILKRRRSFLYH